MDHPRNPRALFILLVILVAVTFLFGTLRTFASAQAAADLDDTIQISQNPVDALAPTLTSTVNPATLQPTLPAPTASVRPPATAAATSVPTPAPTFSPTSAPTREPLYITDMTGIIMLAVVLVVVILVGISWGGRTTRKIKGKK